MSSSSATREIPLKFMPLPTVKGIFDEMTERFGLSPRESQLRLAHQVQRTLGSGGVCCVEAPTGTGKTLGYLAGALDAQAHSGDPVPIVVATATVGLQEQILRHDMPRLAAVGAVDLRRVAVAKGRGRYFCPRTAAVLEDKKMRDGQGDMFAPEKHVAEGGTQIALDMLKAWRDGAWDGDRDNWERTIPACWESSCAASSETCVGRACEHFDRCPYMASRTKLSQAQVIIANHNIVLADLAQRADEQNTTALPPKRYWLIFDEAHNLPEKALATRQAAAELSRTDWLRKLEPYGQALDASGSILQRLSRSADYREGLFEHAPAVLLHALEALAERLAASREFSPGGTSSWGLTLPELQLRADVLELAGDSLRILQGLKAVAKVCSEVAEESVGVDKAFAIRMLAQAYEHIHKAHALHGGLLAFSSDAKVVRWVARRRDDSVCLHTQPLEGQDVLNELLWRTEIPVAMVSATLQIAGSFERFRDKSGLPGHAVTMALPPVFDYSRGFLHQPAMNCEPNEPGFESELVEKIGMLFEQNVSPGMLLLFTSREMMRRVTRALPSDIQACLNMQDHRPLPELIAQHKARIDSGKRSILAGLDSMAEGLDLPGRYCTHVVITRLPFAVPGDPVEEARRELMGKRWFSDAYLADMLTMLIQATGRLIRREDDCGVISVMDKRLVTKRYCSVAASALPGFTRATKLKHCKELASKRGLDLSFPVKPADKKPRLVLAHSNPTPPVKPAGGALSSNKLEPVRAAPKTAEAVPVAERIHALVDKTVAPVKSGVRVAVDDLPRALSRLVPFAPGPFPEHEEAYLPETMDTGNPALPLGARADLWAERQLPTAVMLGLRVMNLPQATRSAPWEQVLSLRPDLVQAVQVLRSHQLEELDARNGHISEHACLAQLERGLAGLGAPAVSELLDALSRMEADSVAILSQGFKLPTRDFLIELVQLAQPLAKELRAAAPGAG